jgi:hypothetical protein
MPVHTVASREQNVLDLCHSKPVYNPPTLAVLRRALGEVLTDHRFLKSTSTSALGIAEFILAQAATGERDRERLKSSALKTPPLSCRANHAYALLAGGRKEYTVLV